MAKKMPFAHSLDGIAEPGTSSLEVCKDLFGTVDFGPHHFLRRVLGLKI